MSGYSGGMRRRLDLAATLVARPQVLFLDEPTTGLDPRARIELWAVLDTLVESGTTIVLTTQYLDEAERLADDIVVVDRGSIIAQGDSRSLKSQVGGDQIHVVVVDPAGLSTAASVLADLMGAEPTVDAPTRSITVPTGMGVEAVVAVARALADARIAVEDLGLRQPTLDEVFLTLTGTAAADLADPMTPEKTAMTLEKTG
jgi:ABC-2 type transport system ATP-binding protein